MTVEESVAIKMITILRVVLRDRAAVLHRHADELIGASLVVRFFGDKIRKRQRVTRARRQIKSARPETVLYPEQ